MTDLEQRVAELERRLELLWKADMKRSAYSQPAPEPVCLACHGTGIVPIGDGYSVNPCRKCHPEAYADEDEDCQPAPEPVVPEDCPTPMECEDGGCDGYCQPKAEECEHGTPYQYPCEICDRPEANSGASSPGLSPGQPEPESQESGTNLWNLQNNWEEIIHYGDRYVSQQEVIALLNAHGITPDSKPMDVQLRQAMDFIERQKERGRELVANFDLTYPQGSESDLVMAMRDWIAEVTK